jgi:hypothetical protein
VFEATYAYRPSLARRAFVQRIWCQHSGLVIGFGLALVIAAAGISSPAFRLPSVFVAGFICWPCAAFVRGYLRAGRSTATYGRSPITVRFTDSGVATTSAVGDGEGPWSAISKAYLTRDFLFLVTRQSRMSIPRAALGEEAVAFAQARTGGDAPSGR